MKIRGQGGSLKTPRAYAHSQDHDSIPDQLMRRSESAAILLTKNYVLAFWSYMEFEGEGISILRMFTSREVS